ncbi:hypothetical protein D9613_011015 [Agrocybe pediades]|uniref:Uncharacterized protein n=1 Tax=Agrocybe pediades TaxID=84607 RepID=A0A8H4QLV7_9AGAR|nr:hypothetical protein D9613_011015 [Agrocybe pediades]
MRGLRCPELKKLPKSSRYTSIHFRNQTPGSLDPLYTGAGKINQVLDPSHPLAGVQKPKLPYVRRDALGVKTMPMGLLLKEPRLFAPIPPLTWKERVQWAIEAGMTGIQHARRPSFRATGLDDGEQLYPPEDYNHTVIPARRVQPQGKYRELALEKVARRVPMSCHVSTSKKRMGADRYMRREVEKRLRAALNYIVARGAYYDVLEKKIKFNPEDVGRKWAMQGWAYLFFPSIELYRMPYGQLISQLRSLLQSVNKQIVAMENDWLNRALLSAQSSSATFPIIKKAAQTTSPLSTQPPVPDTPTEKRLKPNTPLQALAGKTPKVWKRELLAGLKLISKRLPQKREPHAKPAQ